MQRQCSFLIHPFTWDARISSLEIHQCNLLERSTSCVFYSCGIRNRAFHILCILISRPLWISKTFRLKYFCVNPATKSPETYIPFSNGLFRWEDYNNSRSFEKIYSYMMTEMKEVHHNRAILTFWTNKTKHPLMQ